MFTEPAASGKQAQRKREIILWLCEHQMGEDAFSARDEAAYPESCANDA